jgi:hypothetical protein
MPREVPPQSRCGKCVIARSSACGVRAAKLGNDELQYGRRFEDKDISDLKTLIELIMIWIRNLHLTWRYMEEMPPK